MVWTAWFVFSALLSVAWAQPQYERSTYPAIGSTLTCNFSKGACDLFEEVEGTKIGYDKHGGAAFELKQDSSMPFLESKKYMLFGIVEVELKAAPGSGLVTSIALHSPWLDQIDLEMPGGRVNNVETNYFAKNATPAWEREYRYDAVIDTSSDFHNYTIKWTSLSVSWSIDGEEIRVEGLNPEYQEGKYPQTPIRLSIGAWVAGAKDSLEGMVDWAGGYADFSTGPSVAYIRRVTLTDYAGGNQLPKKRTKEYVANNRNGTYQSIKVVETDEGNKAMSEESTPSGGLSMGEKAGIAVGTIASVCLAIGAVFIFWQRRKHTTQIGVNGSSQSGVLDREKRAARESVTQMDGLREPAEMNGKPLPQEMNGESLPQEMDTKREPVELDSRPIHRRFSFDWSSKASSII